MKHRLGPQPLKAPISRQYLQILGLVIIAALVASPVLANDPPLAYDQEVGLVAGRTETITLEGTDSDGPGPYTVTITRQPSHGSLNKLSLARYEYTPNAGYSGYDDFQWIFSDGVANSATATVSIAIDAKPEAFDQDVGTERDIAVQIALSYTDDGMSPLSFTILESPDEGTLVEDGPGLYTYTPRETYSGNDQFKWQANDAAGGSNKATVVVGVNRAPDAYDVEGYTTVNQPATIQLNALDDFFPGPYTVTLVTEPSLGSVTQPKLGEFYYTPNPGVRGVDTFQWKLNDGITDSNVATVQMFINEAPVGADQSASTNAGAPVMVTLQAEDDGLPEPLSFTIEVPPTRGTFIEQSPGTFLYTPNPAEAGGFTETIKWRASDGVEESALFKFFVYVNRVPEVDDLDLYTLKGEVIGFTANGHDDGNPQPLVYSVFSGPAHGTVLPAGGANFVYTPSAGWSGYDTIQIVANDGMCDSPPATVSILVNQVPVALDTEISALDATPVTFTVPYEDDGLPGPYHFVVRNAPDEGQLVEDPPGTFTYTPRPGYTGLDHMSWTVSDGEEMSNWGMVDFAVDDRPVIELSVEDLTLSQYVGAGPVTARFQLTNVGGGSLDYTLTGTSELSLGISPQTGSLREGEFERIEVGVDPQSLAAGIYTAVIEVTAPDAVNSPMQVDIELDLRDETADESGDKWIGPGALVPSNEAQSFSRYVRYRPYDGEKVTVNPPRMSWPYAPEVVDPYDDYMADNLYTLQFSRFADFDSIALEVLDTTCNFYNFLPPLDAGGNWFWRVGFNVGSEEERWSDVRSFTIAADAVTWDRSGFEDLLDLEVGHPRILFTDSNWAEIAALKDTDSDSSEIVSKLEEEVIETLDETWYINFPTNDCPPGTPGGSPSCGYEYSSIGHRLLGMAFLYKLTGNPDYAGFKSRMIELARYPRGGLSSPEGANPIPAFNPPNHITHYLGMFYDWFHAELTPGERSIVLGSLNWRIDEMLNNHVWARQKDEGSSPEVTFSTVARIGWSHPYIAVMPLTLGSLAVYDELPVAREALLTTLHYLIGVTSAYGEDEGWNEGAGYGNDVMQDLLDATIAAQIVFPELDLPRNVVYEAYRDFFNRITPLGGHRTGFGNRGNREIGWTRDRVKNNRTLARLTGSGFAQNDYLEGKRFLDQINTVNETYKSPWIHYVVPAYFPEPIPQLDLQRNQLFAREGWVTVNSAPPTDFDAQQDAVSMTFQARPRGGYSHSFGSENAFDLHAYDETVAVGGGTTANDLNFPGHSMSHNTVLVNGHSQVVSDYDGYVSGELEQTHDELDVQAPVRARVIAYEQGDLDGLEYVYWAGSAANAYDPAIGLDRFVRHVVFVEGEYFVIFDDLRMEDGATADFQWLYHINPASGVPLDFDLENTAFSYRIGNTEVVVQHLLQTEDLVLIPLENEEGQVNIYKCGLNPAPGTCEEDYRNEVDPTEEADSHHIWITTDQPAQERAFLAVVAPYRSGDTPPAIGAGEGSDRKVSVTFRGKTTTISFDPAVDADLVIDPEAIAFSDLVE